jgi:hypothetical protein
MRQSEEIRARGLFGRLAASRNVLRLFGLEWAPIQAHWCRQLSCHGRASETLSCDSAGLVAYYYSSFFWRLGEKRPLSETSFLE